MTPIIKRILAKGSLPYMRAPNPVSHNRSEKAREIFHGRMGCMRRPYILLRQAAEHAESP